MADRMEYTVDQANALVDSFFAERERAHSKGYAHGAQLGESVRIGTEFITENTGLAGAVTKGYATGFWQGLKDGWAR